MLVTFLLIRELAPVNELNCPCQDHCSFRTTVQNFGASKLHNLSKRSQTRLFLSTLLVISDLF